jgi:hypothetical protein
MGKYIHLFGTTAEFEAAYNGESYEEPWVSYTEDSSAVTYNQNTVTCGDVLPVPPHAEYVASESFSGIYTTFYFYGYRMCLDAPDWPREAPTGTSTVNLFVWRSNDGEWVVSDGGYPGEGVTACASFGDGLLPDNPCVFLYNGAYPVPFEEVQDG